MLPPDATPEEIGEFWDTHDLADYWDETEEVEFQVNLKSQQKKDTMKNTIRFGDFVEVNPSIRLERGKEYPYIEMADVTPGNAFVYPLKERVYKGGGSRFQSGDTLFARITPCLENGKIVRSKHTKNEPCFGSTEFFIFRGKPNISDATYVFYLALSPIIREPAVKSMTGASGRQRAILSSVEDIHVPAYSLTTQRKIAATLSAYDNLIENNTRRIKILEDMAQTLYREWFIHFRFPGHENVPMVESPFGVAPQGWRTVRTEQIIKRVQSGKKYNQKTVEPIGNVPVLDQGRSAIIGYHNELPGVIASVDKPIIVFANHTCYQRIIQFPFSAIQNVLPFLPHPEQYRNIYWLHWATKDLVNLNDYKGHWPEFMAKELFLPPVAICERFGEFVKPMVQLTYSLDRRNQNLRQTRDFLLPKLISGEIDVSELDIDTDPKVIQL